MNIRELQIIIDHIVSDLHDYQNPNVMVVIKRPGSAGGTPCVGIGNVSVGFDWDSNKIMLIPDEALSMSDPGDVAKIKKLQDEYGWALYENRNLKAEIKRLGKKLNGTKDQAETAKPSSPGPDVTQVPSTRDSQQKT